MPFRKLVQINNIHFILIIRQLLLKLTQLQFLQLLQLGLTFIFMQAFFFTQLKLFNNLNIAFFH